MYISIFVSVFSLLISDEYLAGASASKAKNTTKKMNKNAICKGQGWFGPNCQYKCRCAGKVICDINGQCPHGRCQRGWFGPACQYVDLAYNRSEVKRLTDGDDDTCVHGKKRNSVKLELKDFYPFTWMRIKVNNSDFLHSLTVLFRKDSSVSCINPKNSSVDDTTLDIYCDLNERVKYVTLTGKGVQYLCSVYISGGRNVALKQRTKQSSMYRVGGNFTSNKAVDGNTSTQFLNNSCSCTDVNKSSAHWNVTFSRPYNVNRYILYNRDSIQDRLTGFRLEAFNENKMSVFSYNDATTSPQDVYTLTSEGQTDPVKSVTISINNTENILTLCEVEVYGDSVCEPGQYGRECEHKCNCAGNEACFISTGRCPSGCADGFKGENCNETCENGSYGDNCTETCSPNCASGNFNERSCDHVNGTCLFGCQSGYNGSMCISACDSGSYGHNCSETCSPNCASGNFNERSCDHVDGTCLFGCQSGYNGSTCSSACENGSYGDNCTETCSPNCASGNFNERSCDHVNGTCLFGCQSGYNGSMCISACDSGSYGHNCSETCSPNCASGNFNERSCDHVDGTCLFGCQSGYNGSTCSSACENGSYGDNCTETCSPNCASGNFNERSCDHVNGTCLFGCQSGYNGSMCISACDSGSYGRNCTATCSQNCARSNFSERSCDHVNGTCLLGCQSGYNGSTCTSACDSGSYGRNCTATCSPSCARSNFSERSCDHVNGTCLFGCEPGYNGSLCTSACEPGTFGEGCNSTCSPFCDIGKSINKSTCHHISGHCPAGCFKNYVPPLCREVILEGGDVSSASLISAAMVATLVAIIVIAAVVIIRRKYRKRKSEDLLLETQYYNARTNGSGSIEDHCEPGLKARPSVTSQKMKSEAGKADEDDSTEKECEEEKYYNMASVQTSTVLSIGDLDKLLRSRDTTFFKDQFSAIPSNEGATTTVGLSPENKGKNRYKNIPAYDHSRVHLRANPDTKHGDYINASFMEGYSDEERFIAAQGPTKATLEDFLRMLIEQEVEKVLMLANLIECGKQKCEKYWPDEGEMKVGEITVKLATAHIFADYTIRRLQLQMIKEKLVYAGDGQVQKVTQFHFTAWPDQGIPSTPWGLVDFEQRVAFYPTRKPVVAHCSAGIGRTGTFIALRNVVRQAEETGRMDFFNTVQKLRHDRINMVQTVEQYIFLHRAAQVAILCSRTSLTITTLDKTTETTDTSAHYGQSKMDIEFKTVCSASEDKDEENSSEENTSTMYENNKSLSNRQRNRVNNILPKEKYRAVLECENKNFTDYINAVLVPSFTRQDQQILTQLPLSATITDFWRLVTQYHVTLIVAFEVDSKVTDETVCDYLPHSEDTPATLPMFKITAEPEVLHKLWKEQRLFVTVASDQKETISSNDSKVHRVTHLSCISADLDPENVLTVIEKIRSLKPPGDGRTLYMCRNGAEYSGLACVLCLLLDRVDDDGCLTVPIVVGAIKAIRHQVIPSLEQYRLLHQVLHLYTERMNEYANFCKS